MTTWSAHAFESFVHRLPLDACFVAQRWRKSS
jgi:hypothetical protein